jgi:4-hydroxy-2-oxoglutarate aldolase
MINLAGLYPPVVTAFNDDESISFDQLEANLHKWVAQPLDGIVVPGSNSEAAFISEEERSSIIRLCAAIVKPTGKWLVAGTGMETTTGTIAMTCQAAELGADAALILPPYFFKAGMTHEVLCTHYLAIANHSPIPILIYNVPAFTGVDISLQTLTRLAEHPRIIGVKDSSANIIKMADVLAAVPGFQVFAGTGSALLPFLSIGAAGGIMALANFAARPLRQLYEAYLKGRSSEAQQIQLSLAQINTAVTIKYGVSGLKYAMDQAGFYGGPCRRPLLPLSQVARDEIERLLENLML